MNQPAKIIQPDLPTIPPAPQPSMFELIMRAVQDPACDPVKMAQLLELSRQVRADDAKAAFTAALVQLKPLLPIIDRRGRIVIYEKGKEKVPENMTQSTPYALWEDIDAAITPLLAEHGFVLTFRCGAGRDGRITVTGVLSHSAGHSEETTMELPLDTSGSKNNVQAVGSSTSYGKRYTATLLLNIRTIGEDDDGEGEGGYHSNPQRDAIHNSPTMDKDMEDGVKNWCEQQKKFLTECEKEGAVADVQTWEETRKDALGRLKRKALPAWSDLMRFKEKVIGNINLKGLNV